MKKLLLSILFAVSLSAFAASGVYAQSMVSESPDIKIVIDSSEKKVENVPIIINGRTMLPLREIASQIGVKNDNEHIKWDSVQRTVYLAKDSTVINLKIDSNTASINEQEVKLDVAPIIYKNRTYIPVRFVSQSFGKKVVWDDSLRSVLICAEENYNKVKEILDNSKTAMETVKRGKMNLSMSMSSGSKENEAVTILKFTNNCGFDNEKKKAVTDIEMNMFSLMNIKGQTYYSDNVIYEKSSFTNKWEKETLSPEEFNEKLKEDNKTVLIDKSDIISAALNIEDSGNPDEIVLTGDTVLKSITENAGSEGNGESMDFESGENYTMKIILEKSTYFIKDIVISFTGKISGEEASLFTTDSYSAEVKCTFTDLNGNYEVVQPADLDITKAVEKSSDSGFEI